MIFESFGMCELGAMKLFLISEPVSITTPAHTMLPLMMTSSPTSQPAPMLDPSWSFADAAIVDVGSTLKSPPTKCLEPAIAPPVVPKLNRSDFSLRH